jgi:hypothetical protein
MHCFKIPETEKQREVFVLNNVSGIIVHIDMCINKSSAFL